MEPAVPKRGHLQEHFSIREFPDHAKKEAVVVNPTRIWESTPTVIVRQ
jgi:hypothetical protein